MSLTSRIERNQDKNLYNDKTLQEFVRKKVLEENTGLDLRRVKNLVQKYVTQYCEERYIRADKALIDFIYNQLFGLGPIEKHLSNPNVTDIFVMGPNIMYIENGVKKDDTVSFRDNDDVRRIIDRIAAQTWQTINKQNPSVDAELYDGSRALLVIPPESKVPYITIRKHTSNAKTLPELKGGFINLTDEMIEYFRQAVIDRKNIFAVGQTSAGKTTFLNALTFYIQPQHVVALLEDTFEMNIPLKYVYSFKTREGTNDTKPITWGDILKDCLRANPNRIILTEIRTPEAAYEFLDTLNSGHRGSMTTIHASSVELGLQKLEMKVKEYKNIDDRSLRELISSTVDIMVFLDILEDRSGNERGRVIKEIAEMRGITDSGYNIKYIYRGGV